MYNKLVALDQLLDIIYVYTVYYTHIINGLIALRNNYIGDDRYTVVG